MLLAHEVFLAGLKPVLLVKHHAVQQHLQALNNSITLARHRDSGVSYHTTKMAVRQKPTASARGLEISRAPDRSGSEHRRWLSASDSH